MSSKSRTLFAVLTGWLALAVSSTQAQGPAAPENTGTLQGRVLNERNAQYVEGPVFRSKAPDS